MAIVEIAVARTFRARPESSVPQNPTGGGDDARSGAAVGGSTVYGALNDDSQTLPIQLEAVLRQQLGRPVEVINAGVPGFYALSEAVFLKRDLLDLSPDATGRWVAPIQLRRDAQKRARRSIRRDCQVTAHQPCAIPLRRAAAPPRTIY